MLNKVSNINDHYHIQGLPNRFAGQGSEKYKQIVKGNKKFNSRLIVGTGKYKNMNECAKAIKISGAEIVTVAVRRVNIVDKNKPILMDYLDPKKIIYLPYLLLGEIETLDLLE